MRRSLLIALAVTMLCGCATQHRRTVIVSGQVYCAKHHRALVSVPGFQAPPNMLVHSADPQSVPCDGRAPNHIFDTERLTRNSLHSDRGTVTFCPVCAADYWRCMGGDRQLTERDVQQITALAVRTPGFRQPIIRIFPVYEHHAIAVGGVENHVGDVFAHLGVARRHDVWVVAHPLKTFRIVALGLPQGVQLPAKRPN